MVCIIIIIFCMPKRNSRFFLSGLGQFSDTFFGRLNFETWILKMMFSHSLFKTRLQLWAGWNQQESNVEIWLVMGPYQKFLTQFGSFFVARFWIWKIFPKNPKFFIFSPQFSCRVMSKNIRVNDGLASNLLQVKSMLGLDQVPYLNLTQQRKMPFDLLVS